LHLRREHREVFLDGEYVVPDVVGERAARACAHNRAAAGKRVFVAVPRCTEGLTEGEALPLGGDVWRDTAAVVPRDCPGEFRNVFTGEIVRVIEEGATRKIYLADALRTFPVAMLESTG
jgi:(1->4)-alpha-D-glucan 1-alpha-D-glucosylmutase